MRLRPKQLTSQTEDTKRIQNASSMTKQLYLFPAACSGNWRDSIYIKCQGEKDDPGYLLAADRDGQPVILLEQQFYQLKER